MNKNNMVISFSINERDGKRIQEEAIMQDRTVASCMRSIVREHDTNGVSKPVMVAMIAKGMEYIESMKERMPPEDHSMLQEWIYNLSKATNIGEEEIQ